MLNGFSSSRPVIDVPDDAGDDVVVATVSVRTLRIDSRCGVVIVGLVGGSIVLSDGLVGRMFGVSVEMLAVFMVAAAIDLGFFVTVSCVGDVWDGVCPRTVIGNGVTVVTRVDVVVGVLTDLLVNTIIDLLSSVRVDVFAGVDANMVAVTKDDLEFIVMRGSLEDSLPFCC